MRCLALLALVLLALAPRLRVGAGLLTIPILLVLGATVLSTALSIAPRVSIVGSYHRLQGLATMLAYVVLAVAVWATVRDREQLERAVTVAIVASVPAALYGIVQHLGLDPLPWATDERRRVIGPAGHPAFLAAYLMMIVPLVLGRLVARPRALAYGAILGVDLTALWLTGSRGAVLGLFAALVFFLVLLWRTKEHRRLVALGLASLALAAVFLLLLQVPRGPLERLRNGRLSRYAELLEMEDGTVRGRVLIWRAAVELMTRGAPLPFVGGGEDPRHAIRWLVGYGPETLRFAFPQVAPPELASLENAASFTDSAHNATLDAFVAGGVLGVLAYAGLVAAVLWQGVKRAEGNLTTASLVAALAGHVVESQFGVASVTTSLLFWLLVALATSPMRGNPRNSASPPPVCGGGIGWGARWLILGTAPLLMICSLRVAQADVAFAAGKRLADLDQIDGARALHSRAIALCPWQEQYPLEWGKTLVRAGLFAEAEGSLRHAQRLNPRNPEVASAVARLYLAWAALSAEPGHARQAEARYQDALRLLPREPDLWNEAAALALDFGGDPTLAAARLRRSLALDPHRESTHLIWRQLERRLREPSPH